MSPHVLIGRYLDDIESGDRPLLYERLAEKCIVDHFISGAIDSDEFHYYCDRFRRGAARSVTHIARRAA
jgi:hypothetical protein